MAKLHDFDMERWQSTYENRGDYNLSESGVHPLTVGELVQLSDRAAFLKLAGSPDFKGIASAKYDMLSELLTRKERAR